MVSQESYQESSVLHSFGVGDSLCMNFHPGPTSPNCYSPELSFYSSSSTLLLAPTQGFLSKIAKNPLLGRSPRMLAFVQSDFTRLYWLSSADPLVQAQVHHKCRTASIS